jgi:hypothetical protein
MMKSPITLPFTLTCAGILCLGLNAGAAAQERERAIAQAQAGLERALKIPLEIVLLRAALRAEAWRDDPRLAAGLVSFKRRIVLAEHERTSLVASFASQRHCDLPPG